MPKSLNDTPKASLTLNGIGPGFGLKSIGWGINNTFKAKPAKGLTVSVAGSDKTVVGDFQNLKKFKDVVLTADYKLPKGGVTANTKYELGPKKYQVGATWEGKLADKATTLKAWYNNKDNLASGEATLSLDAKNKLNTTFNQKQLLTAKYTLVAGKGFTLEPSYSFVKKAPAVSVTKKLGKKGDTLKLAYDIKSEATSLEFAHKPFKLTVSTTAGKSLKFAKPTLAAVFENTYEF